MVSDRNDVPSDGDQRHDEYHLHVNDVLGNVPTTVIRFAVNENADFLRGK